MRGRKRMRGKKDRRSFSRHAMKRHKKNAGGRPMRGGIRL